MASSAKPPHDEPGSDAGRQENLLDQLVPPPATPWVRFAVGLALIVGTVTLTLLWTGGYLAPNPVANSTSSSRSLFTVDRDRDLIVAQIRIPNTSDRQVRLTGVELDADGVELVDTSAQLEDLGLEGTTDDCASGPGAAIGTCTESTIPAAPLPPTTTSELPITIPSDRSALLYLWLDPVSCHGPATLPWGRLHATFDFGPDAIPPLTRTIGLDDHLIDHSDEVAGAPVDAPVQPTDNLDTFLARACDALGRR